MGVRSVCPPFSKLATGVERELDFVVAIAIAVVEVGVFAPYSSEPIPGWHWEDFPLPFLQKPWVSYRVGFRRSGKFEACLALFCAALIEDSLAESSLLPASSSPLPTSHAANSAWTLQRLAIAVEVLATAPWTGIRTEPGLKMEGPSLTAEDSWPPVEAGHDGM